MLSSTSTSPSRGSNPESPVTDAGQNRSNSLARASASIDEPITAVQLRPPSNSGSASIAAFRYDAVSWNAVKIATFSEGVSAMTRLSIRSFGSGRSVNRSSRAAMSASRSRSFRRSGSSSSLNSSARALPSESASASSMRSLSRNVSSSRAAPTKSRMASGGGTVPLTSMTAQQHLVGVRASW